MPWMQVYSGRPFVIQLILSFIQLLKWGQMNTITASLFCFKLWFILVGFLSFLLFCTCLKLFLDETVIFVLYKQHIWYFSVLAAVFKDFVYVCWEIIKVLIRDYSEIPFIYIWQWIFATLYVTELTYYIYKVGGFQLYDDKLQFSLFYKWNWLGFFSI